MRDGFGMGWDVGREDGMGMVGWDRKGWEWWDGNGDGLRWFEMGMVMRIFFQRGEG